MKYLVYALILLLPCAAHAGEGSAECVIAEESVLSHTSAGLPQVSNVALIAVVCTIPERPFPTLPGTGRSGLRAASHTYWILPDGSERLVPSTASANGGSWGEGKESVLFDLHVPLDPKDQDAEVIRYWQKNKDRMPSSLQAALTKKAIRESLKQLIYQHRLGRFRVQCHVTDGTQILGVGSVEFEIVFRGRFSDIGPAVSPPL